MWKRWVYLTLAMGLGALIVFTSTRSGNQNENAGGTIIGWINGTFFSGQLSDEEKTSIVGVAAKLFGHFALFLLEGLFAELFLLTFPRLRWKCLAILLIYSLILSFSGEIIQIFSAGRYPSLHDVFLDMSGFWMVPLLRFVHKR